MYIVHSNAEQSALKALTHLGARLAENPDDTELRIVYAARHQSLRHVARAGARQYRKTTMPTPLHISVDPRGLAAFLSGVRK